MIEFRMLSQKLLKWVKTTIISLSYIFSSFLTIYKKVADPSIPPLVKLTTNIGITLSNFYSMDSFISNELSSNPCISINLNS